MEQGMQPAAAGEEDRGATGIGPLPLLHAQALFPHHLASW